MDTFAAPNKKSHPYSKGSSRYDITVRITQVDYELFPKIEREWIGKEITLNVFQWADITREIENLKPDNIRSRYKQELKDIHNDDYLRPPRGFRACIGLDEFVARANQPNRREPKAEKAKVVNVQAIASQWLMGRM